MSNVYFQIYLADFQHTFYTLVEKVKNKIVTKTLTFQITIKRQAKCFKNIQIKQYQLIT